MTHGCCCTAIVQPLCAGLRQYPFLFFSFLFFFYFGQRIQQSELEDHKVIGKLSVHTAQQTNKAMLLRSDPKGQIVPENNGIEVIQSASGYGLEQDGHLDEQLGLESPIHPLGIKPSGNKLLFPGTLDAREAIGAFQALPDGTKICYVSGYLLISGLP